MKTLNISQFNDTGSLTYGPVVEILVDKIVGVSVYYCGRDDSFHSIIHCEGGVNFKVCPPLDEVIKEIGRVK